MTNTMDGTEEKLSQLRKITNALPMIVTGLSAASEVITILKRLDRDGGLAWIGLPRRKSPLLTLAVLGAGAAIGAGVALWFSPLAGAKLRSAILGRA